MGKFTKDVIVTTINSLLYFILGLLASVLIARVLGPQNQGIYSLSILLASLVVSFSNLGLDSTTVYHIGKKEYPLQKIFYNNLILNLIISSFSILVGCLIIVFFRHLFFENIKLLYLFAGLSLIPTTLVFRHVQSVLLGLQKIKTYNLAIFLEGLFFLILLIITTLILKAKVLGAIIASLIAHALTIIIICWHFRKSIRQPFRRHRLTKSYLKKVVGYGIKIYLANLFGFLNYRVAMFLINAFLNPLAVGLYSIATGVGERLWLFSSATSTVLFPRVSATKDKHSLKTTTPIVSRNILFLTTLGGLALYFLSSWLVPLFFSEAYRPSIRPLQILIPGIIALSAARIFGNDLAGRGKPIYNVYMGAVVVCVNILASILFIPRWQIAGAALASTIAYTVSLIGSLLIYSKVSGNPLKKSIIIQKSDFVFYKNFLITLKQKMVSLKSRHHAHE